MAEPNGELLPASGTTYRVDLGGQTVTVALIERDDSLFVRVGDGPEFHVDVASLTEDGGLTLIVGDTLVRGLVAQRQDGVTVVVGGNTVEVIVLDERAVRLAGASAAGRHQTTETVIRAPMPGLVVETPVTLGQSVARGSTLVILSAMKMQNELTAPVDGIVKEILVSAGQTVDQNQILLRLE